MLSTVFEFTTLGARHAVLATRDGGETWARSELPPDVHPLALAFVP